MSWANTFDRDFVKVTTMDLPWDQVAHDLSCWSQDHALNHPCVNDRPPAHENAELHAKNAAVRAHGYNSHNTKIWKTTNVDPKITFPWESEICRQLPLDDAVATVTRQDPGQVLPWHQDNFYYHRDHYPDDQRPIWRFLLHLEDWQIGHVLQINDSIHTHWQRGDCVVWKPGTWHLSANIGLRPKWTCNITGFLTV